MWRGQHETNWDVQGKGWTGGSRRARGEKALLRDARAVLCARTAAALLCARSYHFLPSLFYALLLIGAAEPTLRVRAYVCSHGLRGAVAVADPLSKERGARDLRGLAP
eukprot:2855730-Pleurochrysis_carterae.AAC.4